jgi:cytochrome P450
MSETAYKLPPRVPVPSPLQYATAGLVVGAGADMAALRAVQRVYGDVFRIPIPPLVGRLIGPGPVTFKHIVMVGNADLVKQVLQAPDDVLHFGRQNPLGTVLGRNSLLAIDEREHMEQRKLILPPFHGARMQVYESIVEEQTLREIESWPVDRPLRTLEPMMRVTLNVIMRAVFGVREGPLMDEMRTQIPRAVLLGSRMAGLVPLQRDLGAWSPWGRFERLIQRFRWGVNSLVDDARNDPNVEQRTDVLSLFAQARHEDDGSLMSDDEIIDQLMTIIAAGHETTATTLSWGFERLSRHPRLLARLVEEADSGGKELRQATVNELQRTRPVIPGTGRYTVKPFELGEYRLPPGVVILLPTPLLHNDPRYYEEPRRFNPDRFVGTRPNPYTWLPFGGGMRRCPGAAFAQMEMDIALRTVLRNADIKTTRARGERWGFRGVAFAPSSGGLASVHPRVAQEVHAPVRLRAVA